ncbi:NTP transferase domain-containing protein [Candidatus Sumerlaeota bacterium]|nr:NTP transferase domain-containing protein [Candidatus Sumerlaeota bacterium]
MGSEKKNHPQEANRVIVIMAGGAGERFWPVSNRAMPKQLLRLHGDKTLIQASFERAEKIVPRERIYIAAGEKLREPITGELPALDPANYIAEPFQRNTAACLGLAACRIEKLHSAETVIGVLTADHVIEDSPEFFASVGAAMDHAASTDDLVAIGMKPTYAETGYGYLELGGSLTGNTPGATAVAIHRVARFTEKPDMLTAEEFLVKGNYLWNSGMFFWRAGTLLAAFEKHEPLMAAQWRKLRAAAESEITLDFLRGIFSELPSLPIDIAIMEKAPNVAAIAARFRWEDVGSWDALARINPPDEAGNCKVGSAILLDSRNNIIYNDVEREGGAKEGQAPEIVLHGVDDLIVVRTGKAILVTPKSHAQKVKNIVRSLEETGRGDLL